MKKIILWLDMYKTTLQEYFNRIKNNQKALAFMSNNKDLQESFETYEDDPDAFESTEINCSSTITIRVGEVVKFNFIVEPEEYSSQRIIVTAPVGLSYQQFLTYLHISAYQTGTFTLTLKTIDEAITKTVTVNVVNSNS